MLVEPAMPSSSIIWSLPLYSFFILLELVDRLASKVQVRSLFLMMSAESVVSNPVLVSSPMFCQMLVTPITPEMGTAKSRLLVRL